MPTVAVYDIKNQQVGDIELNENIFGVEVNEIGRASCRERV